MNTVSLDFLQLSQANRSIIANSLHLLGTALRGEAPANLAGVSAAVMVDNTGDIAALDVASGTHNRAIPSQDPVLRDEMGSLIDKSPLSAVGFQLAGESN